MQPHEPFAQFTAAVTAGDDTAAESLCTQLDAADEPALLMLAQSAVADERWWGVCGLAHCGTPTAIPTLSILLTDTDASVRAAAALALGHIHARAKATDAATDAQTDLPYLAQLAALLADPDGLVRQTASAALALCGDDAVPVLHDVLKKSAEGPRTHAAHALRTIATNTETLPAAIVLYQYLDDANHLVRTHAYEALDARGLLENQLVVL